jgi:Peptide N-acetyl-beta-D-glucosaminyl asparaginase amidase A
MLKNASLFLASAVLAVLSASFVRAQVVISPSTPQIGSSNPVTAAPLVSRPSTKPCTVPLFSNLAFDNFTPASFNYTPPSDCKGPWAKVVFTADFTVTAGTQFDRTAAFYLGHANIFYGTTSEPTSTLSPSWHVERDVTDLSAIFKADQIGEANIGNFVGVSGGTDYNGIIYANAALEFYPANFANPAPATPDIVVPVNGTGGDAGTLNTTTDTISQTLDLPENVESVYLDVISQPQSNDEFYYFNVPDNETNNLQSFGGTAFRETEIWIDGKPAGVAPVYPFINTGGIDPNMWFPIPGNQTQDFKPYRVNLTPFAGLLSDGSTHIVAVSVFNADSYFLATANLLVYQDHQSKKVTGGVLENTLSEAPVPKLNVDIKYNSTTNQYTGTISDDASRSFTIRGYINTSHGRVETTIAEKVGFTNKQEFDVYPSPGVPPDIQSAQQLTTVDEFVTTQEGFFTRNSARHFSYPLQVNFAFNTTSDGGIYENVSVDQQYLLTTTDDNFGQWPFTTSTFEETKSQDDQAQTAAGVYTDASKASQTYQYNNSRGGCYSETLTAANNVLTDVKKNCRHE